MPTPPADHPDHPRNDRPRTIAAARTRFDAATSLLEQNDTINPKLLAQIRATITNLLPSQRDELVEMSPQFVAAARKHGIWPEDDH